VEYLSSTRKERADGILRISQELANSKVIVSALRDHTQPPPGFPWKDLADRMKLLPQRPYPGAEAGQVDFNAMRYLLTGTATLVAIMDLDGAIKNLSNGTPSQRTSRKTNESNAEDPSALRQASPRRRSTDRLHCTRRPQW